MAKYFRKIFGHTRQTEDVTPGSDGTVASPTKTILDTESGTNFFVDISSNTAAFVLPAPQAGLWYRFTMATASDDEGTKSLILATSADSVDFGGAITGPFGFMGAPAFLEVTANTSKITLRSSGAATVGDFVEVISDGTDWYVTGRLEGGAASIADNR
jgi:hypothetical protein